MHWVASNEKYAELIGLLFGYRYDKRHSKSEINSAIAKINFVIQSNRDDLRVPFSNDSFYQLTVYKDQSYFYLDFDYAVIDDLDTLEDARDNKAVEPVMVVPTKEILGILMDLDYFYNKIMVKYENVA